MTHISHLLNLIDCINGSPQASGTIRLEFDPGDGPPVTVTADDLKLLSDYIGQLQRDLDRAEDKILSVKSYVEDLV